MELWEGVAGRWEDEINYQREPVQWVGNKLGEFLWSAQRRVIESIRDNRYTAVHSAHDLGKSMVASRAAAWWVDSHTLGDAFVVSTAPTAAQVAAILWREIGKAHRKGNLPGKINRAGYPQWYVNGNELIGYGRKPADYEDSAFQGIHSRYPLIVMDEACGIGKNLFDAVDALATNENARVLAIGNPDDPGSHFASICKPGSDWNVIHLDGLRSPNLTKARVIGYKSQGFGYANPKYPLLYALMVAEGIPFSTEEIPEDLNDLLISELWIEERIRRWCGINKDAHLAYDFETLQRLVQRRCASSPLFQAKVRGLFPTSAQTGVIPLGWVQLAVNRWHDAMDDPNGHPSTSMRAKEPGRKVVGIDIAGEGADETVFAIRYGNLVEKLEKHRQGDVMETADLAAVHLHEPGAVAVPDVIGIGSGVYSALKRMKAQGLIEATTVAFNAGAKTPRTDMIGEFRFRNDRAAAWWKMRELLDPSRGSMIALPDDEALIQELVTPKYKVNVGGIIQIEEKAEIRKRIGRSTDSADAVIQSFWVEGQPQLIEGVQWGEPPGSSGVVPYEGYDPFTDEDFEGASDSWDF